MPENVSLISSRQQLSELEQSLSKFMDKTQILESPLEKAKREFDYIILDTPPNPSSLTTIAAYSSADWFLLTTFPHRLSLEGLNGALKDIADVRATRNPKLEVLGVLVSGVDKRTNAARETEAFIKENFENRAFSTYISAAIDIPNASKFNKTIFQVEKRDKQVLKVQKQYRTVCKEIEHRTKNREEFLKGEKL